MDFERETNWNEMLDTRYDGFSVDWAKVTFSILICIIGLVGNSMTMFVIVILREYKKSVTHWYVLQLAIADTIFLLTLPFKANEDLNDQWIYPVWMCKAKESILFLNYYASILFLMIMSVDRYIAVCHTFSEFLQKFRRQFAAGVITLVTWMVALLLCTPFAMYSTKTGVEGHCKCEYEFELAPKKTNFTENCLNNGITADFLDLCINFGKEQEEEETFCRANKGDLFSQFLMNNTLAGGSGSGSNSGLGELSGSGSGFISWDFGSGSGNDTNFGEFPFMNETSKGDWDHITQPCDYSETTHTWKAIIYFNFFGMFVIPLFVMVISYGLIISRLRTTRVKSNLRQSAKSTKSMLSANGSTSSSSQRFRKTSTRSDRDRRRVTIMCATLVLSFTICWILFHAVHLAKLVGIRVPKGNNSYCYTLGAVGGLLGYLNSALNPYLYSFLGTNFSRRWSEATRKLSTSIRRTDMASGAYNFTGSKRKIREASQTAVTRMNRSQMVSEGGGSHKSRAFSASEQDPAATKMTTALTT